MKSNVAMASRASTEELKEMPPCSDTMPGVNVCNEYHVRVNNLKDNHASLLQFRNKQQKLMRNQIIRFHKFEYSDL